MKNLFIILFVLLFITSCDRHRNPVSNNVFGGEYFETNELTCVQGNDHPLLFSEELTTSNQFLLVDSIPEKFIGTAKVRYRQKDQECEINILNDRINIKFATPQRSVTPGQSVVIYQDNKCLGGGEISAIN